MIPKGQSNVVWHDQLNTARLSHDYEHIEVTAKRLDTSAAVTLTPNTDYVIYHKGYTPASGGSAVAANFPDTWSTDYPQYTADTLAIKFLTTEANTYDMEVTVTYKATLLTAALVGDQTELVETPANSGTYVRTPLADMQGNDNRSKATFGNKQDTEWDWTRTYTWEFDLFKYAAHEGTRTKVAQSTYQTDADEDDYKTAALAKYVQTDTTSDTTNYWIPVEPLEDATFKVQKFTSRTGAGTEQDPYVYNYTDVVLFLISEGADDGSTASVYRPWLESDGNANKKTVVETPKSGLVVIQGLDSNNYRVEESASPVGYEKLHTTLAAEITRTAQGTNNASQSMTMKLNDMEGRKYQLDVQNYASKEMPMTGGMGTTVLYIVGGMLVILAGAYLFFSRKRTA